MRSLLGELTSRLRENIYLSLLVVSGISVATTYFWIGGGGGNDTTICITDESVSASDIVVDISGAVASPGVYSLMPESRMADVLKLSGGILGEASGKWVSQKLNLSEKLSDSQKIYVPFEWDLEMPYLEEGIVPLVFEEEGEVSEGKETAALVVNMNTASQEELEGLPRIGEVTAKRIMDNRPYEDVYDLKEKAELSDGVITNIEGLIVFK